MRSRISLSRLAAASVASAALVVTAACGSNGLDTVRAQSDPRLLQTAANGSAPGTGTVGSQQMLVNCGPYQRTLVRTTYLNGQPVSQVDCVPGEAVEMTGQAAQYGQPFVTAPVAQPVVYQPEPRVVRTVSSPAPVRTRTVSQPVYQKKPVRTKTKSAVIIGSTAAAGAGVGALIGGKKGAIIGAIAGGGGALV